MLKKFVLYTSLLIAGTIAAQEVIAARGQRHAAASYLSPTNLYRIGGHMQFNPCVFQRFPLTKNGTPDRRIINTGKFTEDQSLYSPGSAVHGKYLYIVTGSLVVEQIFAVPGIGRTFVSSITDRDYPMIMGTTIVLAVLIVVMNLVSDILYKVVDPRINLE